MKFSSFLSKRLPEGYSPSKEIAVFFGGLFLSAAYTMILFLHRFFEARSFLYQWVGNKWILRPDACISSLSTLLDHAFFGFFLLFLLPILLAGIHYLYHTKGSKSIYLMKRLPDPRELHRRCLFLPCLMILGILAAILLLFLLCLVIYLVGTPDGCFPPDIIKPLRSVLL